jgi:hypothetical protein
VTTEHLPKPELLTRDHRLDGFDCGEHDINEFLINDALGQADAGFSQTWVIASDHVVQGYVSLSAASQPVKVKQGCRTHIAFHSPKHPSPSPPPPNQQPSAYYSSIRVATSHSPRISPIHFNPFYLSGTTPTYAASISSSVFANNAH